MYVGTTVVISHQIRTGWSLKFGYLSQKSSKIWMQIVEIKRELFVEISEILPHSPPICYSVRPLHLTSQIQFYSIIQFWATIKSCLLWWILPRFCLHYSTCSTMQNMLSIALHSTKQYKVLCSTVHCTVLHSTVQFSTL